MTLYRRGTACSISTTRTLNSSLWHSDSFFAFQGLMLPRRSYTFRAQHTSLQVIIYKLLDIPICTVPLKLRKSSEISRCLTSDIYFLGCYAKILVTNKSLISCQHCLVGKNNRWIECQLHIGQIFYWCAIWKNELVYFHLFYSTQFSIQTMII